MKDEVSLLKRIGTKLDAAGIPYMVTGSLASGIHGEARTTHDVDIIIAPTLDQLRTFVGSLGDDFYVSSEAAEDAFRLRGMFNVIEPASGLKADLFVRKDRPFDVEQFRRRRAGRVADAEIFLVSPEDSILSKLDWARKSGSERQFRDALGVAAVQGDRLDRGYLEKWARELGVEDELKRLLDEAQRFG